MTQDELKALLDYNPETGVFTSLVATRGYAAKRVVGCVCSDTGYRVTRVKGKKYGLHRLAFLWMTGALPQGQVDHINGRRDDNRWANLRDVTVGQNRQNIAKARSDSRSGLVGAGFHPQTGKWRSRIRRDGVYYELGLWPTPEEAHAAYLRAKAVIHTHHERLLNPSLLDKS